MEVFGMEESEQNYVYHHGTGKHYLVKEDDSDRKKYSLHCCWEHCVDGTCIVIVVAFLIFAFWLPYYLYNNYGDGG